MKSTMERVWDENEKMCKHLRKHVKKQFDSLLTELGVDAELAFEDLTKSRRQRK